MVAQQKHCYMFLVSSGMLHVTHSNLPDMKSLTFLYIVASDNSTTVWL